MSVSQLSAARWHTTFQEYSHSLLLDRLKPFLHCVPIDEIIAKDLIVFFSWQILAKNLCKKGQTRVVSVAPFILGENSTWVLPLALLGRPQYMHAAPATANNVPSRIPNEMHGPTVLFYVCIKQSWWLQPVHCSKCSSSKVWKGVNSWNNR